MLYNNIYYFNAGTKRCKEFLLKETWFYRPVFLWTSLGHFILNGLSNNSWALEGIGESAFMGLWAVALSLLAIFLIYFVKQPYSRYRFKRSLSDQDLGNLQSKNKALKLFLIWEAWYLSEQ